MFLTLRRGVVAVGLGVLATASTALSQQHSQATNARQAHAGGDLPGPVDNFQDLADSGKMVFKLADTNNDGQISQKEAVDAGNLLVGGFFFRADADGNGTLTAEEARQARESLLNQQPLLRFVLQKAKAAPGAQPAAGSPNPAQALAGLLDTNSDRQVQATELRQAVQTGVQGAFAVADTNRDGQMSPTEVNAAIIGAIRAASQASFQAADTDRNGQLSQAEFNQAITGPASFVFSVLDANGDGQISPQEGQSAQRIVGSQVRMLMMPDAPNSPTNLIGSGRTPDQVAPVPAVPVPAQPGVGTTPNPIPR